MNRVFDFHNAGLRVQELNPSMSWALARYTATKAGIRPAVESLGWRYLPAGTPWSPPEAGDALVVGVALWSVRDLTALNGLADQRDHLRYDVFVFNVDDFTALDMLARIIPGVPPPLSTPSISQYADGVLVGHAFGDDAVRFLINPHHPVGTGRSGWRRQEIDGPADEVDDLDDKDI